MLLLVLGAGGVYLKAKADVTNEYLKLGGTGKPSFHCLEFSTRHLVQVYFFRPEPTGKQKDKPGGHLVWCLSPFGKVEYLHPPG